VRDPINRPETRYNTTTDVVQDRFTGLTWERNPSTLERTHADASAYCSNLELGGTSDWRLPSRNELFTIVEVTQYNPALDTATFGIPPGTNFFWSSSVDALTGTPWFIAFREGRVAFADAITLAGARCVR
jgi:hypothetical protein